MRSPLIIHAGAVIRRGGTIKIQVEPDLWIYRPINIVSSFYERCRAAWFVFTGRADALVWVAPE